MTTLPTFIIIGAHKAGTTSLYEYLIQHPDIYLPPIKETNYFAYDPSSTDNSPYYPIRTWEEYIHLYRDASDSKACGDVSPEYLINPSCAQRIKEKIPRCKIIVSLREPISRAYSHYTDEIRTGARHGRYPPLPEDVHPNERWIRAGFYYRHLKPYYDSFDHVDIFPIRFESIVDAPGQVAADIFNFLDVDADVPIHTNTVYNSGGVPTVPLAFQFLRNVSLRSQAASHLPDRLRITLRKTKARVLRNMTRRAPELSIETRNKLAMLYRDDIAMLQDLTHLDLHSWLDRHSV